MTTINMPMPPVVNERISLDQQLSDDDFVTAYKAATEGHSPAALRICDEQGGMFTEAVDVRMDAIAQANVNALKGTDSSTP